jgi:hypothetical protein
VRCSGGEVVQNEHETEASSVDGERLKAANGWDEMR